MADNFSVQDAAGTTRPVAGDDIGGVVHQRMKVSAGGDGSAADVGADGAGTGLTTVPKSAGDVATGLAQGRRSNSTPGTAIQVTTTSTPCKWVVVSSVSNNATVVNVGASGVLAAVGLSPSVGTSTGIPLDVGGSVTVPVDNANKVYFDVRTSGDAVSWLAGS